MTYILRTHDLTKNIDGKKIVSDVNIHVKKGEIYGFLGPNGAGKTTIMKMVANLWKPTSGEIEIFGEKLTPKSYNIFKRMSSIIEFPTFYNNLSGKENLKLHCEYMGYNSPDSVEKALTLLDLPLDNEKAVRNYSLGMKQRLGLARAMLTKPEILMLDEPMNGLDPAGMKQIRDLIKMFCKEYGITILISSHLLMEIENIADTIGIIHNGKMITEISMDEISKMNLAYIDLEVGDVQKASVVLDNTRKIENFKIFDGNKIRIYDQKISSAELSYILIQNDVELITIGKRAETLEDYFLKITMEACND